MMPIICLILEKGIHMKKIMILLLALFSINAFAKPVNVNTADAKTLSESLKGIGQKKAEEIVQYRTNNGPFETISDLMNVKGVGKKTIEKNEGDILLSKGMPSKKSKKPKKAKKTK